MALTEVILVDEKDQTVGRVEKLKAHQEGALHRAITVYIFNPAGELLMQQRAEEKYHCGGLWSNTCCGHPVPHEETAAAARRRLYEEMGLRCELTPVFDLQYRLALSNGLIEHEFGHVFFGISQQLPKPDPAEAMAWRWQSLPTVAQHINRDPAHFTPWFRFTMTQIPDYHDAFMRRQKAS